MYFSVDLKRLSTGLYYIRVFSRLFEHVLFYFQSQMSDYSSQKNI